MQFTLEQAKDAKARYKLIDEIHNRGVNTLERMSKSGAPEEDVLFVYELMMLRIPELTLDDVPTPVC